MRAADHKIERASLPLPLSYSALHWCKGVPSIRSVAMKIRDRRPVSLRRPVLRFLFFMGNMLARFSLFFGRVWLVRQACVRASTREPFFCCRKLFLIVCMTCLKGNNCTFCVVRSEPIRQSAAWLCSHDGQSSNGTATISLFTFSPEASLTFRRAS